MLTRAMLGLDTRTVCLFTTLLLSTLQLKAEVRTSPPINPSQGTLVGTNTIISPDKRFSLEGYTDCYYKLTKLDTSTVILEGSEGTHRECFAYMGFSHDSSLFYVYDQNSLDIAVFDVHGNLVVRPKVASDPYIESVSFSKDNNSIIVQTSSDGTVIIDLDDL